jgi:phage protein D
MPALSFTLELDGAPAPAPLLAALQRIEVEDHAELADMLRLRFALGVQERSSGWTLLDDDYFPRLANLCVKVNLGRGPAQLLANAYVIETRAEFANAPGQSTLEVVAMDPTVLMNLDEKVQAWPNMSDSDIASAVFGDAAYGFALQIESTTLRREERNQTVLQRGTDIRFLKQLAVRNGFECYVETDDATGAVTGHFHPPRLQEEPQGVLAVNMGETTNVNRLRTRFEMLRPAQAQVTGLEIDNREAQPVQASESSRTSLGRSSAAAVDRPRRVLLARTGMAGSGELQAYAQAVVDGSAMAIVAEGELNTAAYGALLRARRTVALRGAGQRFSGVYYVDKVVHVLDGSGHLQRFSMRRNALGLTGGENFADQQAA